MLQKRLYSQITGKVPKHDVIAYQIRQSFKPGEITPEEANRLGHELAMRFTKGMILVYRCHAYGPVSAAISTEF